jgi:hypothetical protein
MNDSGGEELPIIDVRSPAERWADSGRDGFDRLQDRFRSSHLDVVAVAWMAFLVALVALQVYEAWRPSSRGFGEHATGWEKAALLSASGSFVFSMAAMIGMALACSCWSRLSRVVLGLAAAVGLWAVIANLVGIAVAFHVESAGNGVLGSVGRGTEEKVVQALGAALEGGFGIVVFLLAVNLLTAPRLLFDDFDDADDFDVDEVS